MSLTVFKNQFVKSPKHQNVNSFSAISKIRALRTNGFSAASKQNLATRGSSFQHFPGSTQLFYRCFQNSLIAHTVFKCSLILSSFQKMCENIISIQFIKISPNTFPIFPGASQNPWVAENYRMLLKFFGNSTDFG